MLSPIDCLLTGESGVSTTHAGSEATAETGGISGRIRAAVAVGVLEVAVAVAVVVGAVLADEQRRAFREILGARAARVVLMIGHAVLVLVDPVAAGLEKAEDVGRARVEVRVVIVRRPDHGRIPGDRNGPSELFAGRGAARPSSPYPPGSRPRSRSAPRSRPGARRGGVLPGRCGSGPPATGSRQKRRPLNPQLSVIPSVGVATSANRLEVFGNSEDGVATGSPVTQETPWLLHTGAASTCRRVLEPGITRGGSRGSARGVRPGSLHLLPAKRGGNWKPRLVGF